MNKVDFEGSNKGMEINEEKRKKIMEYAGKRVNNVLHDIQILEPMSRSTSYDYTRQDVEEMFNAMQETLNNAKMEFERRFEEKARTEKKVFSFGTSQIAPSYNSAQEVGTETLEESVEATSKISEAVEDTIF